MKQCHAHNSQDETLQPHGRSDQYVMMTAAQKL